jgi:hypothetical protein
MLTVGPGKDLTREIVGPIRLYREDGRRLVKPIKRQKVQLNDSPLNPPFFYHVEYWKTSFDCLIG